MTGRHGLSAAQALDMGLGMAVPARGQGPYATFNLGDHVGDDPEVVASHRAALARATGAAPVWLQQVHGARVVQLSRSTDGAGEGGSRLLADGNPVRLDCPVQADGSWTTERGLVCTVMVADCLPVLLAAPERRGVAALHAGWRGLAGAGPAMAGSGVLEAGVQALCIGTGALPGDLQAWLGPCIGPTAFEVGPDVLAGFGIDPRGPAHPQVQPLPEHLGAKWLADLAGLARDRLRRLGLRHITGGQWCTVRDSARFFSFRRDGVTGRQAACVWMDR